MEMERTYIMVKPEGVQRGLVGEIIGRFEARGYRLSGLKLTTPPSSLLQEHYRDLEGKPFYPKLISHMSSGPVCAMVFQGRGVVAAGRMMLGATNPLTCPPGTIRGDFGIDTGRNVCHGSDSAESAEREIALWFKEGVETYTPCTDPWVYEMEEQKQVQGQGQGQKDKGC